MSSGYPEFWTNIFLAGVLSMLVLWTGAMIVLIAILNELRSMKRRK